MINTNEKFKRYLLASCAIMVLSSFNASAQHLTVANVVEDDEDGEEVRIHQLASVLATTFNEQMTGWNQENGGDAGNVLTNFVKEIENFDPAAFLEEQLDKALENMADTVSGAADEITGKLKDILSAEGLMEMVGADKILEIFDNIPSLDEVAEMIPNPQEVVDEVVGQVQDKVDELTGMIEEIPEQLSKLEEETIGKIKDLAQNANPEELLSGLEEIASAGNLSEQVQSKVDELTQAAEGLKEFQNLEDFTNLGDLQSKAEEAMGVVDDIKSAANADSLKEFANSNGFIDAIMNSEDVIGNVTDAVTPGAVSDVIQNLVESGEIDEESAKAALDGIVNLDDAKQAMESLGLSTDSLPTENEFVDAIVNGNYEEKIEEMKEAIQNEIANLPEDLKSQGEDALNGLISSISDGAQNNPFMKSMQEALEIAGQAKAIEEKIKELAEGTVDFDIGDINEIIQEAFPEIGEQLDEALGFDTGELSNFESMFEDAKLDYDKYLSGDISELTDDLLDIGSFLDGASGMLGSLGGLLGGGGEPTISTPVAKDDTAGAVESGDLTTTVQAYSAQSHDTGTMAPIEKAVAISQDTVTILADGYSGSVLLSTFLEKEGEQTDPTGASNSDQVFNELGKQEELTSLTNSDLSLVHGEVSRTIAHKGAFESYRATINSGLSVLEASVPNKQVEK